MSREVLRPEVVGDFFSRSNIIDAGNQLRQDELALEKLWLTQDPWFRIDTTVVGVCVIDAFLAAQYQAPPSAGMSKMSVKNYALRTAYDLWHRPIAKEPISMVQIATPEKATATSDGIELEGCPRAITLGDIMLEHDIKPTDQRSGAKKPQPVRRKCSMGAEGCFGQCTFECYHPACRARDIPSKNRWGGGKGTFICGNNCCRVKHYKEVLSLSKQTN